MSHLRRAISLAFAAFAASTGPAAPDPGLALDKESLIATITAAGLHETAHRRHMVHIDDCTMKTHLWQKQADHGWVLWSSFTFSMPATQFTKSRVKVNGAPRKFLVVTPPPGKDNTETAMIAMTLDAETPGLYERSTLRHAVPNSWPSTRNDGTTHRFSRINRFYILHEGPGVARKAQTFTTAFEQYVKHHCTFTG